MTALVLGTAGHVDHGKTALVKALTGVDTDRWKEEKERGLTIDIGFAHLDTGDPQLEVGVVDVPGHEDFVKNMLAGATGIDLLLLVVAADEGPMPQTREHLLIAHLLGIGQGIVALTKSDRADRDWRDLSRAATRDELRRVLGHDHWPIIDVSAVTGEGLTELRAAIRQHAAGVRPRDPGDYFRLPVDRSFSLPGAGTVVTGTVWSGEVAVGETVRVLPHGERVRVRSAEVHGQRRERVGAGRRCALALVGIDPATARRGSVVVREAGWRLVSRIGGRIVLPVDAPRSVSHNQRVRVFLGTREVMARLRLPEAGEVLPGDTSWAVLESQVPVVARVRDRFILRFYSPVATVGGGAVAELEPPGRWRERTAAWHDCLEGEPEEAAGAAVELAGGAGVLESDLPLVTGLPLHLGSAGATKQAIQIPGTANMRRIGDRWFSARAWSMARKALLEALRRGHQANRRAPAESLEALRAGLARRFADPLLQTVLAELEKSGEIVLDGPRIRLPDHSPRLTDTEEAQLEALAAAVLEGGLEPPGLEELEASLELDRSLRNDLLRLLVEWGRLVAITPELYLAAEVEAEARTTARRVLERSGTATPATFKEVFRVSRKYLIPLLEHLDRAGVTRRTAEGRVLVE